MRTDWTGSGGSANAYTASARLCIDCATSTATIPTIIDAPRVIAVVLEVFGGWEETSLSQPSASHNNSGIPLRIVFGIDFGIGNGQQPRISCFPRRSAAVLLSPTANKRVSPVAEVFSMRLFHQSFRFDLFVVPDQCASLEIRWGGNLNWKLGRYALPWSEGISACHVWIGAESWLTSSCPGQIYGFPNKFLCLLRLYLRFW